MYDESTKPCTPLTATAPPLLLTQLSVLTFTADRPPPTSDTMAGCGGAPHSKVSSSHPPICRGLGCEAFIETVIDVCERTSGDEADGRRSRPWTCAFFLLLLLLLADFCFALGGLLGVVALEDGLSGLGLGPGAADALPTTLGGVNGIGGGLDARLDARRATPPPLAIPTPPPSSCPPPEWGPPNELPAGVTPPASA